jgi:hypothetical protein
MNSTLHSDFAHYPGESAPEGRSLLRDQWAAILALLGFLFLGMAMAVVAIGHPAEVKETTLVVQAVPKAAVSPYDAHGFFASLPKPSTEVARLLEQHWVIDRPDNGDAPQKCGHRVRVNGRELTNAHRPHQSIGNSERGAYSVWGETIESGGLYFSLPAGVDTLSSLEVEWQLSRNVESAASGVPVKGLGNIAIVGWGAAGLAVLAVAFRPTKLGWGGTVLIACAGLGLSIPVLAVLLGAMDELTMASIHRLAIASISWVGAACVLLVLVVAVSGGRRRCFGSGFPATLVIATIAAVFVGNQFVIGRTGFADEWVAFDKSGVSDSLIASRMPFSDAAGWFVGSQAVMNGAEINWAARRPLHATIRAGQLVLGGGYDGSLLLQAGFLVAASTALACAVWRALSPAAGIAVLIAVLQVSHGFERSFLSECTGLSIGCLAVAMLIDGWSVPSRAWRLGGAAALGAAWLVRPGPFALLALPALVEVVIPEARRWRRGLVALIIVIAMLGAGKVLFKSMALTGAVENANAAPTVYGLATGMTWSQAYADLAATRPESNAMALPQRTALMYEEAWRRLRQDPWPCIRKLWSDLKQGFQSAVVDLPTKLWIQPAWRSVSLGTDASRSLGYLLLCIAIAVAFSGRRRFGLVAAGLGLAAAGSIASLPVIWGDGGMRGTILAQPFVIAFLSLPIALLQTSCATSEPIRASSNSAPRIAAIAMLGAFVAAGLTAFAASRRGPHDRLPIEVDLRRVPSVILTPSWRNHGVLGTGFVPVELAASSLKLQPKEYKLDSFVRSLRPGTALVLEANLETPSQWIVVDGLEGRSEGRLKIEETQPTANRYFLKAIKWNWVD